MRKATAQRQTPPGLSFDQMLSGMTSSNYLTLWQDVFSYIFKKYKMAAGITPAANYEL